MVEISLVEIQKSVEEIALKVGAPFDLLPTYGFSRDLGYPHIEVDNTGNLDYIITERGQVFERKTTKILDELLYWIFDDVTFQMAGDYEVANRIENKDGRRIIFKKQEELLRSIRESWGHKQHVEHNRILVNHPFDDLAGLRASFCAQLRQRGYSEQEIDKLAFSKFPEN